MAFRVGRRGFWCTAVLLLCDGYYIRGSVPGVVLLTLGAVLMSLVFRRYPEKTLFELLQAGLPGFRAKVCTALTLAACFAASLDTVQHYEAFVESCVLPQTPAWVTGAALIFCAAALARRGAGTLCRWSGIVFVPAAVLCVLLFALSLPACRMQTLIPVLREAVLAPKGLQSAVGTAGFGFSALLCFWGMPVRRGGLPTAALCAGAVLILNALCNTLVLSAPLRESLQFDTYFMTGTLGVGDFFRHVQILAALLAQLSALAHLAALLLVAREGMSMLFSGRGFAGFCLVLAGADLLLTYSGFRPLAGELFALWNLCLFVIILCTGGKIRKNSE